MPMTLAHPAAVVPLRRLGLPMSALVAGSMFPDVPLFLRWWPAYRVTHSAVGVVTVDLVGAVLVLLLWFLLVRDALVDLSPAAIRERLPARARPTPRQWALAPVAAALGAATHVLWDAFTHAGRWGVTHVPWLREQHHGAAGYAWAQFASGAVGLAVVGWAVVRHLRTLPPNAPRQRAVHAALLPAVVLAAGVCGLATAMRRGPEGLYAMAFSGVINAVVTFVVGTAVVCAAWHLRSRAEVT